jgi:hypothetical protein
MRRSGIMLSGSLLWLACSPAEDEKSTRQEADPVQGDDSDDTHPGDGDGDGDWVDTGNDPDRDKDGGRPPRPGLDGGTADSGPADGCQPGACCIRGIEFLPGAANPDDACQVCDPALSEQAFSPADGNPCGVGCSCATGRHTEVLCADADDNDGDSRLDCADADCGGKLCRPRSAHHVLPSRDLTVSQGPVGGPSEENDQPTLTVSSGNVGQSWARFEFDNISADSVIEVESAVLNVYVESNNIRLSLRDPAGNEIGSETGHDGFRTYDMTSLVKQWANGTVTERFVTLNWGNSNRDAVRLRATEYDGEDSDPYLFMSYEAYCHAGACPAP